MGFERGFRWQDQGVRQRRSLREGHARQQGWLAALGVRGRGLGTGPGNQARTTAVARESARESPPQLGTHRHHRPPTGSPEASASSAFRLQSQFCQRLPQVALRGRWQHSRAGSNPVAPIDFSGIGTRPRLDRGLDRWIPNGVMSVLSGASASGSDTVTRAGQILPAPLRAPRTPSVPVLLLLLAACRPSRGFLVGGQALPGCLTAG